MKRLTRFTKLIWHSIKIFWKDDHTYQASALSFITILSIVPFLSILTYFIKISGKYSWMLNETNQFIYTNFLPETSNVIQHYLEKFSNTASKLPLISILFSIITALMLINTLERALNNIWNVKAYRSYTNKLISWSALLAFPIFIAMSSIMNDLINLFIKNSLFVQSFLSISVFLSHVVIFTMFYIWVPNVRLKFKNALIGGVLVAVLYHGLKFLFMFYITYFTYFGIIYGSLAVIPIFLTWLYFSWSVFLFGAIYIHTSTTEKKLLDL